MNQKPEELLAALRQSAVPVEDSEVVAERRERAVARIERSIEAEAKAKLRSRKRRVQLSVVLAAAAAVLVAVGLTWRAGDEPAPAARVVSGGGQALVLHAGRLAPSEDNDALDVGDEVRTPAGKNAALQLSSGVQVKLAADSKLSLRSVGGPDEQVQLWGGHIDVTVPRLGDAGRFSVVTPNARVEVHGTEFGVTVVDSAQGLTTRVSVVSGVVSVVRDGRRTELRAGEQWSSATEKAAAAAPIESPQAGPSSAPPIAAHHDAVPANKHQAPSGAPSSEVSELAAQNALFAQAVAARRNGDDARAVDLFGQLLSRYPDSPLAQEARVERFRALKRLGRKDDAAKEARQYLQDNAQGAASSEAKDLASPK